VISPTLAFGASYVRVTNNVIGAIETMLALAWVGVTCNLIGGMPICIIGSTGPVLALSTAIGRHHRALFDPFTRLGRTEQRRQVCTCARNAPDIFPVALDGGPVDSVFDRSEVHSPHKKRNVFAKHFEKWGVVTP
jgi:hypothetical protein